MAIYPRVPVLFFCVPVELAHSGDPPPLSDGRRDPPAISALIAIDASERTIFSNAWVNIERRRERHIHYSPVVGS